MNSALLLLAVLRLKGFARRWGTSLKTAKGFALTLVGLLVFAPWLLSVFVSMNKVQGHAVEGVRHFGPYALLGYAILALFLSTGERVLYFSPAEVAFLFSGPFRQRQLLAYKLMAVVFTTFLSAAFFTLAMSVYRTSFLAGFVGIFGALLFFQLVWILVGLILSTVGAMANTVKRRILLAGILVLLGSLIFSLGKEAAQLTPQELLDRAESSTVLQIAVAPFRPFVLAFTAERIWPDLIQWSALAFAMVLVAVVLVFLVNASYLEALAASSARTYQRIQQVRRGGTWSSLSKRTKSGGPPRIQLPDLPLMGGVGPVFWRQILAALRDPVRVTFAMLVVALPGCVVLLTAPRGDSFRAVLIGQELMAIWMIMFLTPMVPFDFRGDLDRMETLKTLPIHPIAMSLGQILTPALLLSFPQALIFCLALLRSRQILAELCVAPLLIFPANLLLIGIENLIFLWFPTRVIAHNPGDFAAIGRQMILIFAKLIGMLITGGVAVLGALGVYYLVAPSLPLAMLVAFIVAMTLAAALLPLIALAYQRFDVSRDMPA